MSQQRLRQRLHLTGRVQGVGFRPFVHRLAQRHHLGGWVRNQGGAVCIEAEGTARDLAAFNQALIAQAPPLASPQIANQETIPPQDETDFSILTSKQASQGEAALPLDSHLCPACQAELFDPGSRRYRYPFINCSHCGPRYTLLDTLPYDRARTGMRGFAMCPACTREYHEPHDRRFHAEPIACPQCGPALHFRQATQTIRGNDAALAAALALLRRGGILALKGVGAYQLLCDAKNEAAVRRLRVRKHRPDKPLAVMFPEQGEDGLAALAGFSLNNTQADLLRSPQRPIVLCQGDTGHYPGIAPGLSELGIMLPASPLHTLLLHDFGGPLVATSANPSGEPVVYDEQEAEARLGAIADGFLHHDRPIHQRADDPVYRLIAGQPRPLRIGRGDAPLEMELPHPIAIPTLALGSHMKNTVALAWGRRCVLSPHIGELDSPRALQAFEYSIAALQRLYGVRAERLLADAHPGYGYWPWARQSGLPVQRIFHHHAHASALYGESSELDETVLIFTWDGSGYGPDGSLWGGEGLLGRPGAWQHFSRMRPFRLPGGDRATREPWRCAAALCWETGLPEPHPDTSSELLHQAWQRGHNCPPSSAVGRLFDAAAALLGLCQQCTFEGQAAMLLESLAQSAPGASPVTLPGQPLDSGTWQWDWQPLLALLQDTHLGTAERALAFHLSLAYGMLSQAQQARRQHGIRCIGLSGGVFQNRLLSETARDLLEQQGFQVLLHRRTPSNDAALPWGQLIEDGWPDSSDAIAIAD